MRLVMRHVGVHVEQMPRRDWNLVDRPDSVAARIDDGRAASAIGDARDRFRLCSGLEGHHQARHRLLSFAQHHEIHGRLRHREVRESSSVLPAKNEWNTWKALFDLPEQFTRHDPLTREHAPHADRTHVAWNPIDDLLQRKAAKMHRTEGSEGRQPGTDRVDHRHLVSLRLERRRNVRKSERRSRDRRDVVRRRNVFGRLNERNLHVEVLTATLIRLSKRSDGCTERQRSRIATVRSVDPSSTTMSSDLKVCAAR